MPVNNALALENWNRFVYARDNGHTDFLKKAYKCDRFTAGDQWKPESLRELDAQRRPAITINKIMPTVGNIAGEQIQSRTEVLFRPKNGSKAETAEALTKVWKHLSQENQLPWVRSSVFFDGIVRSRGFYDVRMQFNDSMQGEIDITLLNSKNVVIDPDADEYDPDTWNDVFITKWLNGQDISILYSEEDGKLLTAKNGSSFENGIDSFELARDRFGSNINAATSMTDDESMIRKNIRVLERQHRMLNKQLHFVDIETGDMRAVPADWDRDRISLLLEKARGKLSTTKKVVKRIRWTVTADDVVLHDDWSPYRHLTVVPYFPYFRYGDTVGVVENLLGPQEVLNKVSSQELHIVNTTANSGWKVEEGSLTNMTVEELESTGAKTGLVVEYKKGAQPPDKIQPNQTPTGLDRISYKAEEHIKSISGVSDSMQGFDREDVAAKAIAYKTQRGSVNLVKSLDNLERTDYILTRNCLDLIQEYYTEPRLLNIINPDVTQEPEEVGINQIDPATGEIVNDLTLGEYNIIITSTPHRASAEDSQFEQALAMRKEGINVPDSVLIENSRLTRRADIIKQMEGDKNSPEAKAAAELQQQGAIAEVENMKADAELKRAQALAATQAATKTAVESQSGGQADLDKQREELRMKQESLNAEIQAKFATLDLKQQEMQQKLELKRQEHEQASQARQAEQAQSMVLEQQKAAHQRALDAKKQEESEAGELEAGELEV